MNDRSLLHHRRHAHPDAATEWLLLVIGIVTVVMLAASIWVSFHIPHPNRDMTGIPARSEPAAPAAAPLPGPSAPAAPRAPEGTPASGTVKP